jgi:hypothetical protein
MDRSRTTHQGSTRERTGRSRGSAATEDRERPIGAGTVTVGRSDSESIAPELAGLVVPIASLTPHPRNPRIGEIEAISASLRRFGQL